MDAKVPIMVDLISQIIGLPKAGVNPSQYFIGKDNDKKLAIRLKKNYCVVKDKMTSVIHTVSDHKVHVAAKLLGVKVVQKNRSN